MLLQTAKCLLFFYGLVVHICTTSSLSIHLLMDRLLPYLGYCKECCYWRWGWWFSLLRVPGLGTKSAWLIVNSRRFSRLTSYDLKKMGVVMKKAKYFITCHELSSTYSTPIVGINELHPERLRPLLISKAQQKRAAEEQQLKIDFGE